MMPPGAGGIRGFGGIPLDDNAALYVISVAAELSGLHPQTLRQYDRLGLVSPDRATGRGRRYSLRDIAKLREVSRLSQEEGVNLAGIKRILELEDQVAALRSRVAELRSEVETMVAMTEQRVAAARREVHALHRRELVPLPPTTPSSVVLWQARSTQEAE